jgi:primosomal protein N' (replication factor Y)
LTLVAHESDTTGPTLWIESPEARVGPVARVALIAAVDGEYSFAVPEPLAGRIEPGKRVLVPFGKAREPQPAFCVALAQETWTSTLRPLADVVDDQRLLDDRLLELGRWISRYYFCPLGRTLAAMVPEPVRSQSGFRTLRIVKKREEDAANEEEGARGRGGEGEKDENDAARGRRGDAVTKEKRRSPKQLAVLETLAGEPAGIEIETLEERAGVSRAVISNMIKAGLLVIETRREAAPAPDFDRPGDEPTFELNANQRAAIDAVSTAARENAFKVLLLFGVSGSGKTEVYIHSIRSVLARGRQAILLVPEIALTTQIVTRLASRFHDVAVIHSGLTGVQRSLTYAAIVRGEKRVIIGTRSAVFAPCPDLGLIVVDEEQEPSYKNQQSPRFNTRDVAIKRAQMLGIPIVLGSATPSLETWHNSQRLPHFQKIDLPSRIAGLPMPAVKYVDMQIENKQRKGFHLLSQPMEAALGETLARGEQAVMLLNRRGYASYLVCNTCRQPVVCPNCRANMTFHDTINKAICHHCNAKMILPKQCGNPSCRGTLVRFGMGTQRVEEELKTKFPQARVARADSDTMTHTRHYEELVREFAARNIDVLLGTQMIAKGLDFPFVSFVGVVNADTSMSVPDFRAAERTFQMITQVAGRAARAQAGGRVIVQSLAGESPALQFAAQHDYVSFAGHELAIRQRLGWPPFSRLARVVVAHHSPKQAQAEAERLVGAIRDFLHTQALKADVLGPQTAPLARLRNTYRFDFLIRAPHAGKLMEILDTLRNHKILTPNTRFSQVDVDPAALL